MMFYVLNENVYLVKGKTRGCIYDFNSLKLYSINQALTQKIELANQGQILYGHIEKELEESFENLINIGVLRLSEIPISRQIDEIRLPEYGIGFAWIEITNNCNLRCIHCYNESNAQSGVSMSLKDYQETIDKILELGIRRIQIIGGEPFINREILKEMLDYSIGKFRFIEIFTNGTLVPVEWMEYLAKNNIHIALSVYSYYEEVHDKITNCAGSWKKTNKTITALKEYGIDYRVCNVLMKGVELGERTTNLYELNTEKDIVRMSGRANFSLLSDELIKKRLITKKTFKNPIKKEFCGTLLSGHNCFKNKIYISANKEVYPCVMERRVKHCVISDNSGIVLNEEIRNFNKDKVDICNGCEFRYACFDCRPNSLSGNIYEKPWYCTYDPMIGEWEEEENFIAKIKEEWKD